MFRLRQFKKDQRGSSGFNFDGGPGMTLVIIVLILAVFGKLDALSSTLSASAGLVHIWWKHWRK